MDMTDAFNAKKRNTASVEWNGGIPDGVAIFWKYGRFEKIMHEGGMLNAYEEDKESSQPWLKVELRDNNYQKNCLRGHRLTKFKTQKDGYRCSIIKTMSCVSEGPRFPVGTTMHGCEECGYNLCTDCYSRTEVGKTFAVFTGHFKSGTQPKDLPDKAAQARHIATMLHDYNEDKTPVIFACDFNNNCGDDAFKLFYSGDECSFDLSKKKGSANHPYGLDGALAGREHLESAYPIIGGEDDGEHPSTWKWRKGGEQIKKIIDRLDGDKPRTIDSIFYSRASFTQLGKLSLPHRDEIQRRTHGLVLPSPQYPSDHLMIMTELAWN